MSKGTKLGFIGAGNMGEAMIKGLTAGGTAPGSILALDADKARLDYVASKYKVKKARDLKRALDCDAWVVAVKPQSLDGLLEEVAALKARLPLIISIVAGAKVKRFLTRLGAKTRVVRVMPNTPALIGQGVSAYYAGPGCQRKDLALARSVVEALGPAHQVKDEALMDAVTGLSGSGPAYVFVIIEALADAGVMMGLPRALALSLAANTVAGAARMVIETGEHPGSLKDKVASPGGTTIAGLAELERGGLRAALIDAVEAAALRSEEMGAGG